MGRGDEQAAKAGRFALQGDDRLFCGANDGDERARSGAGEALPRAPPARRDDVAKLVEAEKRPGVMVIVDGVFHDKLAVGHAEIRDAIQSDGGSGASRRWARSARARWHRSACVDSGARLRALRGGGRFPDDEVALLHEPTAPYRAVTEPLVHLRAAIDHLVERGIVADADGRAVVADLKSRWFGERTVRGTIEALARRAPQRAAAIRRELSDFNRFALKTLDLERFLEEQPWSNSNQGGSPQCQPRISRHLTSS